MNSPGIVAELDVLGDVGTRALPCRVDRAVHALVLQCRKERFGHGVIITYPGSTDRLPDPMFNEGRGEASRGIVGLLPLSEWKIASRVKVRLRAAMRTASMMSGVL